jgi:hypothetical protein
VYSDFLITLYLDDRLKFQQKTFQRGKLTTEVNGAFFNDCCEFRIHGKGKAQNEFLDLHLADGKRFLVLGKLLLTLIVLHVSPVCCKRGFSQINLVENNYGLLFQPQI